MRRSSRPNKTNRSQRLVPFAMSLSFGITLGPYSVTAKIGEGGMGGVILADDTQLGGEPGK